MTIFFSSDYHFSHTNILRFCDRPFKSVDIMDRHIIKRHNEVVRPEDTTIIAGDFTLMGTRYMDKITAILSKMNGSKILVYGNHDRLRPEQYIECGFTQVLAPYYSHLYLDEICMTTPPVPWIVVHDPALKTAMEDEDICLCGHIHQLFRDIPKKKIINVGVDVWDYYPVSEHHIAAIIEGWKHHEDSLYVR